MSFPSSYALRFIFFLFCAATITVPMSPAIAQSQSRDDVITIGTFKGIIGSLIYMAQMQGYFSEMGLKVEVNDYQAGKFSVDKLLTGEIHMAAASDFVFARQSFARPDLRILASICEADTNFMIARSDRGIKKPSDIAGKKVGLTMGSVSEFFLGDFLAAHGLSFKDIEIVNARPPQIVEQMINGTLDAALTWAYYVFEIKQALGKKVATWSVEQDQSLYFLLFTTEKWLKENQTAADKVMRALAKSDDYLQSHPDDAKMEIQRKFKYSNAYMNYDWPHFICSLTLSQGLLTTLADQADWLKGKGLVKGDKLFNYRKMIYLEPLEQAKPNAITLIR